MTSDIPASRPAGWGALLLLGALLAFPPMSIDMYLPSLPALTAELGGTAAQAGQTVAVFFAGLAAGQLVFGPLSDRLGRRPPVLLGVAVYVAASLGCALAGSMEQLLAWRLLQALGACAGVVVARAVVRDRFEHHESARVLSTLSLIMGLAPITSPLVGGWILAFTGDWRVIFAVLAGFGSLIGVAVLFGLPETRSQESLARARSEHPFRAYLALLRQKRLLGYLLAGSLNGACLFTYIASAPGLLIEHFGVRPVDFGWWFGVNAFGIIGGAQVNRMLLRRRTPDQALLLFGAIGVTSASALALAAWTGLGGMAGVLIPLFVTLGSYGVMTGNTGAGALSVDPTRAGSTSALMGALSFGAGALAASAAAAFHDVGPRPMASVILLCMLGAQLAARTLAVPRR